MKIKPPGAALLKEQQSLNELLWQLVIPRPWNKHCFLLELQGVLSVSVLSAWLQAGFLFFFFSEGLLLFFQTQIFYSFSTLGGRLFALITTPKMSFVFLPQNTIITCMWSKAEFHSFATRRASPWQGLRMGKQSICWDDSQQSSVLFG